MLSNNNFTPQDIMQHQLYLKTCLIIIKCIKSDIKSQPKHTMILSWINDSIMDRNKQKIQCYNTRQSNLTSLYKYLIRYLQWTFILTLGMIIKYPIITE